MLSQPLHIVSFDNPYPPSYGGAIDVFYKIRALRELGFAIHLHCFAKERSRIDLELCELCKSVTIYSHKHHALLFLSRLPFSVISRRNSALLSNLRKINAPILFESEKTTCLVNAGKLGDRFKILRRHNNERDYFNGLADSEASVVRRILYRAEARKFERYDNIASKFDCVATLSMHENAEVQTKYGNALFVPVFHGNDKVRLLEGKGEFVLYHGDLETADNLRAAKFLASAFKKHPAFRLVIASGSSPEKLSASIGSATNITYVKLRDAAHLNELFAQAHINICWSFQRSGTKLKVVNALFNGRFSIINPNIIDDPKVAALCHVATDETAMMKYVEILMGRNYDEAMQRKSVLELHLSDLENAKLIANVLNRSI